MELVIVYLGVVALAVLVYWRELRRAIDRLPRPPMPDPDRLFRGTIPEAFRKAFSDV